MTPNQQDLPALQWNACQDRNIPNLIVRGEEGWGDGDWIDRYKLWMETRYFSFIPQIRPSMDTWSLVCLFYYCLFVCLFVCVNACWADLYWSMISNRASVTATKSEQQRILFILFLALHFECWVGGLQFQTGAATRLASLFLGYLYFDFWYHVWA